MPSPQPVIINTSWQRRPHEYCSKPTKKFHSSLRPAFSLQSNRFKPLLLRIRFMPKRMRRAVWSARIPGARRGRLGVALSNKAIPAPKIALTRHKSLSDGELMLQARAIGLRDNPDLFEPWSERFGCLDEVGQGRGTVRERRRSV